MRVSFPPHSIQNLLSVDFFFYDGHSDHCEVYLIVVLMCISLIISDVEPFHVLFGHLCLLGEMST